MNHQRCLMRPTTKQTTNWQPAPLRQAGCLLGVAIVLSGLILIAMVTHLTWLGSRHHADAGRWMKTLTLSAPALWPAGSPMRHPETVHPAIDLGHIPGMERSP